MPETIRAIRLFTIAFITAMGTHSENTFSAKEQTHKLGIIWERLRGMGYEIERRNRGRSGVCSLLYTKCSVDEILHTYTGTINTN